MEVAGEWRDTKEPKIVKFNFDNMSLSRKGIYEGPFSFEYGTSIKMYGLAEFHEKTNELYVNYTSQIIDGKETDINELSKYTVILGEKNSIRYIMLFSAKKDDQELGMFYFYRK
jgi:hypothetical protein